MEGYQDFLRSKLVQAKPSGFDVDADELPADLFPWQKDIVRWALRLGRAAIFADCGLGKTPMQLAWADLIAFRTGKPTLILAPLAVAPQTAREGEKFGISVNVCRSQMSVKPGVNVTNYQKLLDRKGEGVNPNWDVSAFGGVVLDESSILKSFMGKTKRTLIEAFRNTPYRLACTATPAPNDHMELGNHSQFLGVMDSDEMISRWFINDTMQSGHYRLKRHAEADYWRWVASWACCVSKPSDLGYSDAGYQLPPLDIQERVVEVDATDGSGQMLFRCERLSSTGIHKEMRFTASDRAEAVAKLVAAEPKEAWVIWCNTDYEADELRKRMPKAVEVRGSMPDEKKEERLAAFASGESRVLITKPSICGFGLNWQHCSRVAFVGLSYSHEQFYQAVRRTWRFGQQRPVVVYVIIADTEGEVLAAIKRKELLFAAMKEGMVNATRENQLDGQASRKLVAVEQKEESGPSWRMVNGDCCEVVKSLDSDSIDFTIFSPPFSNLYIYSDAMADMGNAADDAEFFQHFGFLVPELYRVTVPGRICAVHCKDLPLYKGRDGAAGLKDFPGEIIRLFERHGWTYHSRVTIWKDPVIEMQRTKNNGLLHKTLCRDSSQSRQGMADFILMFRKFPAESLMSAKPVERHHSQQDCFTRYVGDQEPVVASKYAKAGKPEGDPSTNASYGVEVWQRYASPVWFDIDQTDVLNYQLGKEGQDEKHICPLQLGVIRRAVELWSSPGDLVLSPFGGIGSEGYVSVLDGRRFVGVELKESYWRQACKNLARAEEQARQVSLFGEKAIAA